jgi:Zinc finger, ZZ type
VRFHCSTCDDYDLCSPCHSSGATSQHDPDHSFYWIQYCRLSLPPANGEDLELLQRFKQGSTSVSFYLHYPWFFGPAIYERLISRTKDENESRSVLIQLQETLEDVQFHVALDAFTRLEARDDWNWHEVQDHVKPVTELQIVRSRCSGMFYSLYSILRDLKEQQNSLPSHSTATALALRRQLLETNFDSISMERCKKAMNEFMATRYYISSVEAHLQTAATSRIVKYTEMLSTEFDVSMLRP